MNHCKWLMIGSITPCNKSCRGKFCWYHLQSVRNDYKGPTTYLFCAKGVRGKSQLCLNCCNKLYRDLKRSYDKRIEKSKIFNDPIEKSNISNYKVIKNPQDYIDRFIIKANNELDK